MYNLEMQSKFFKIASVSYVLIPRQKRKISYLNSLKFLFLYSFTDMLNRIVTYLLNDKHLQMSIIL